jgi:Protein of unknown function (DUF2516)
MPVALALDFYRDAAYYINISVTFALVLIEAVALINCVTQRADAFPVVGSLSKNAWIGILLASVLVTAICGFGLGQTISIFAFAAITAAAVYLLDVRPALRDATNGSGGW